MLGEKISDAGISVIHADSDADTLIISTALDIAETSPVTVAGEDTDLLILLLYHYRCDIHKSVFLFIRCK